MTSAELHRLTSFLIVKASPMYYIGDALMVSLDVEKIPRFYRGKKKERSDKRYGELDASRKTLKKEEPHVK
jgi:hypothetical protein